MSEYHDDVWGRPLRHLTPNAMFGQMSLQAFQAGLSWSIVLKKSKAIADAFHGFDLHRVADMTEDELAVMLSNGEPACLGWLCLRAVSCVVFEVWLLR